MALMRVLLACVFCLGLAAAAEAVDWSSASTITIVEVEYAFDPSRLTLHAGTPYRLRFENHGKELHEFTAPAFLKAADLRDPEALNAERTEVVVQPGEQKDVYLVPRQTGRYPFLCADHDWAGMTGEIVVE
jgi:plastocyanin